MSMIRQSGFANVCASAEPASSIPDAAAPAAIEILRKSLRFTFRVVIANLLHLFRLRTGIVIQMQPAPQSESPIWDPLVRPLAEEMALPEAQWI